MKSFIAATLFCMFVLALGAFAQQGSMQQPAQTPQAPGAASQTPQQPGMPPSTMPQTQPGTMQNPDAQSSQAPMHSGTSGVDDQVSALSAALNLNSGQQAKVKTILEDQHQQATNLVSDTSLSRDAKLQKIHELRQSTIDKVRGTLTSDEQKNKFDSMVQAQNDRIRERELQQQQQQNNPPSTPK